MSEDNLLLKVIFAHRGLLETDRETKKELLLHHLRCDSTSSATMMTWKIS